MYCPRCAAQQPDSTKFCRACGADLKAVALALSEQKLPAEAGKEETPKAEKSWLEKRSEGVRNTVQGSILLAAALLIGLALAIFSDKDAWIFVWIVFFGWLACWGVIALAQGIGAIMESGVMLGRSRQIAGEAAVTTAQLPASAEAEVIPDAPANPSAPPLSVTEYTTERLGEKLPASKQSS
jgi:hypothetical protein